MPELMSDSATCGALPGDRDNGLRLLLAPERTGWSLELRSIPERPRRSGCGRCGNGAGDAGSRVYEKWGTHQRQRGAALRRDRLEKAVTANLCLH